MRIADMPGQGGDGRMPGIPLQARQIGERMFAMMGVYWAVIGIGLLLGLAIARLAPMALSAFESPWMWPHWLALIGCVGFMAYAEGYHGFQRSFAPRFGARCRYLYEHPSLPRVLFAPLFCMGFFGATRRRRITSLALTAMIVALIIGVEQVPQPWRGIIDAGVCVGLIWGLIATMAYAVLAFTAKDFSHPPEVA